MAEDDLDDLHWALFTAERAAAEERDADALDTQRSGLTMRDHYIDAMHRGDGVVVLLGSDRWSGTVADVHGDAARVDTESGTTVHVRLSGPQVLEIVSPATSGGRTATRSHGSLEAVLHEAQLEGRPADLRTTTCAGLGGVVRAVGRDHVSIHDAQRGLTAHVPLEAIVAVVTPGNA